MNLVAQKAVSRAANIAATVALLVGVFLFAFHNLGNRNFWSDEASSFLTAMGFPPVGQESSGLAEAWATNSSGLEPGMFNWIERFWALGLGTDIVTLRAFPFVLFLIYAGGLLILSRMVKAPWIFGCAVVGLMFLENITPYYSVELRPSIAGLAAAVLLPLVGLVLVQSSSLVRGLIIFVPVFIVFASMQYNSLPIIVALATLLVFASFGESSRNRRLVYRVIAFVVLMWLPFLYLALMGNPFDLVGGDSLKNIPEAYIPNMPQSEALRVIITNFFSFTALPRTAFILLLPALWLLKKFPLPLRESHSSQWVINAIWIVVFVASAATALLGVLGFIPWILGTRWSISEIGLIALSLIGLVGLLAQSRAMAVNKFRAVAVGISLVICIVGAIRMATYERTSGFNWNAPLEIIFAGKPGGTLIDLWTYPELRYWVEYSGEYDEYRDRWISHEIEAIGSVGKVETEDIRAFIDSDADRLLIRSESLLEGISLPPNIRVIRIEPWESAGNTQIDHPALLVRN